MSDQSRIAQLEAQLASLAETVARLQAIEAVRDAVLRFCRGLDRLDSDLMASVFHPDAQVDYGKIFVGPADAFVTQTVINQMKQREVQHLVGNILVRVNGDSAVAESYELARHKSPVPGGTADLILAMRTLDRFDRRDGEWRISHRKKVVDWARKLEGVDEIYLNSPLTKGTRDQEDYSQLLFGQTDLTNSTDRTST